MQVDGFDAGEGLAAEIEHAGRAVPLVIVSATGGSLALPGLDATLEHDLAGLANIVVVDEEGSWALTDVLGSNFSCYAGAVRLYWPHFSATQDRFFHPFWTGDRLRSIGADVMDCRERFRKQLRSILFRAAALSVARPREIDNIRDAADRATVVELRQRATSLEEFEELADSYATDNEQLRAERTELRSQVDSLQEQVGKLEADRQALLAHLQAAKSLSTQQDAAVGPDDVPDDTDTPPKPGDVRFYKKVHSRPTHDVMRRVADCGCENWQGAHGADKARKGIAKIESNRSDWKAMQHCASCTGGGMWRVRW
jgi:outer membrane murein-binding lipoprotein Lpp